MKNEAWSFPFFRYSREGEFLNTTGKPTSLAVGSSIPLPPAAGGWGIFDPRPVYSVGLSGLLAGGAEEEAAWSERRFAAKFFPSHGGAPWSFVVESSSSLSSLDLRSGEFVAPSPASAWRSRQISSNKKKEVMLLLAVKMVVRDVSSLELATGDFPSVEGLRLIQAIKGRSGGGAPPAASGSPSASGSRGPCCIFPLLLERSVRTG